MIKQGPKHQKIPGSSHNFLTSELGAKSEVSIEDQSTSPSVESHSEVSGASQV